MSEPDQGAKEPAARHVSPVKNDAAAVRPAPESPLKARAVTAKSQRPGAPAPKEVHVSTCIRRLFDLDTQNQTFGVSIALTMMWKLPADGQNQAKEMDGTFDPQWKPVYRIINIMEEISDPDPQFSSIRKENGEWWCVPPVFSMVAT